MKRLICGLLVMLLAVSPAFAERSFSTFDHVTGRAGGGRSLYLDFPDISLLMPIEWETLVTIEQSGDGVSFYQTASLERYAADGVSGGGLLFRLCASKDERFRGLPAYGYLGYSDKAGLHFYLELPSDHPAYPDDDVSAAYDGMASQIDWIIAHAKIRSSMRFYTIDEDEVEDGNGLA